MRFVTIIDQSHSKAQQQKFLKKIVAINLTNHLDTNKLIYKNRFGFQKGKSTEHNLLLVTNFIADALNDGDYCIGVFLDLKKAFDTCLHKILLKNLNTQGSREQHSSGSLATFPTDSSGWTQMATSLTPGRLTSLSSRVASSGNPIPMLYKRLTKLLNTANISLC